MAPLIHIEQSTSFGLAATAILVMFGFILTIFICGGGSKKKKDEKEKQAQLTLESKEGDKPQPGILDESGLSPPPEIDSSLLPDSKRNGDSKKASGTKESKKASGAKESKKAIGAKESKKAIGAKESKKALGAKESKKALGAKESKLIGQVESVTLQQKQQK